MKRVYVVSKLLTLTMLTSCASFWSSAGTHIHNTNDGNVGIGTGNPGSKLTVVDTTKTPIRDFTGVSATISSPSEARAVYGAAINPNSTYNYGGYFTSKGQSSGVFGEASDKERGEAGGVFHSWGKHGKGVIGLALNPDAGIENYGGWFDARGEKGVGLFAKGGRDGEAAQFAGKVVITRDRVAKALVVNGIGLIGGTLATELHGGLSVSGGGFFTSNQGYAVWAVAEDIAKAGLFQGDVSVVGNLSKSSGGFKIDHPLDPENKYLYHSFVESPDMLNIYNGNVKLDSHGEATVELPTYFEALNKDFRYQLTPLGMPAPNLYIAKTVVDNSFKIAGGQPGMVVSWQVTGVRKDVFAEAHRIIPEVSKEPENRGKYLNAREWGKSANESIVSNR